MSNVLPANLWLIFAQLILQEEHISSCLCKSENLVALLLNRPNGTPVHTLVKVEFINKLHLVDRKNLYRG